MDKPYTHQGHKHGEAKNHRYHSLPHPSLFPAYILCQWSKKQGGIPFFLTLKMEGIFQCAAKPNPDTTSAYQVQVHSQKASQEKRDAWQAKQRWCGISKLPGHFTIHSAQRRFIPAQLVAAAPNPCLPQHVTSSSALCKSYFPGKVVQSMQPDATNIMLASRPKVCG